MNMDDELLAVCQRLARHLAWRVYDRQLYPGHDVEDLENIALLKALKIAPQYDPARGKPATFFYRHMQGAIQDELRAVYGSRTSSRYRVARCRLSELETDSGDRSIQDRLALPVEDPDLLAVRDELRHIFCHLAPRERSILLMRYGELLSQEEVGRALGVSASSIGIIEKRLRGWLKLPRPRIPRRKKRTAK